MWRLVLYFGLLKIAKGLHLEVSFDLTVLHAGMDSTSSDELKRQQREGLQPAKEIAEEGTCRQAEVAATITAFATNFARGQKAIVSASGLSRLTQLLFSSRPSVQEKALCALLV